MKRLKGWCLESLYHDESTVNGGGLFTNEAIAQGAVVLIWGGILVPYGEFDPKLHSERATTGYDNEFCLTEAVGVELDVDQWLNHSCDSNTWMYDARTVIARRNIRAGEEITLDFALWWDEPDYTYTEKCGCNTVKCRTKVTGGDWKLEQVQKDYFNHFVPFINDMTSRI